MKHTVNTVIISLFYFLKTNLSLKMVLLSLLDKIICRHISSTLMAFNISWHVCEMVCIWTGHDYSIVLVDMRHFLDQILTCLDFILL